MENDISSQRRYLNEDEMYELHGNNVKHALVQLQNTPIILGSKSSVEAETRLRPILDQNLQYFTIRNEMNQGNLSPQLDELIRMITKNQKIADELNDSRTQMIVNMINTFNQTGEMYAQHIRDLTIAFSQNHSSGFNLMDIIQNVIGIIPKVIKYMTRKR